MSSPPSSRCGKTQKAVSAGTGSVDNRPGVKIEAVTDARVRVISDGSTAYEGLLEKGHWVVFRGKEVKVTTDDGAGIKIYLNGRNMGLLGSKGEQAESTYYPYK